MGVSGSRSPGWLCRYSLLVTTASLRSAWLASLPIQTNSWKEDCDFTWLWENQVSHVHVSVGECLNNLVPRIQQHDVILAEVILSEARHLGDNEATRLIGAFKQSGLLVQNHLLQSVVRGVKLVSEWRSRLASNVVVQQICFIVTFWSLHRELSLRAAPRTQPTPDLLLRSPLSPL